MYRGVEYSTGEYKRQGRITRCGNWRERTASIEKQLDLDYQRPLDTVQVYEIEKLQRFKESHYRYCAEAHYKAPKDALG